MLSGGFVVFAFISIVFDIATGTGTAGLVAQTPDHARSVQMRLSETFDKVIFIIISRTVSPGANSGFGACLYQPNGAQAPGNVCPLSAFPIKGLTYWQ